MAEAETRPVYAIRYDRFTACLLGFGSGVIVLCAISCWPFKPSGSLVRDLLFMVSVPIVLVAFGPSCVSHLYKLFKRRPAILIDGEGIDDHSNFAAVGRIPWQDVTGIETVKRRGASVIVVNVNNADAYQSRGNYFQRRKLTANAAATGSPINIFADDVNAEINTIESLLMSQHQLHHRCPQDVDATT